MHVYSRFLESLYDKEFCLNPHFQRKNMVEEHGGICQQLVFCFVFPVFVLVAWSDWSNQTLLSFVGSLVLFIYQALLHRKTENEIEFAHEHIVLEPYLPQ